MLTFPISPNIWPWVKTPWFFSNRRSLRQKIALKIEDNIPYQVGMMNFIRISNRFAVLGRWAELNLPLLLPLVLASEANGFAQELIKEKSGVCVPNVTPAVLRRLQSLCIQVIRQNMALFSLYQKHCILSPKVRSIFSHMASFFEICQKTITQFFNIGCVKPIVIPAYGVSISLTFIRKI